MCIACRRADMLSLQTGQNLICTADCESAALLKVQVLDLSTDMEMSEPGAGLQMRHI